MTIRPSSIRRTYTGATDDRTVEVVVKNEVVRFARILDRNTDGLSTLAEIDGTCPSRSNAIRSDAIGDVVTTGSTNRQIVGSTGLGSSIFGPGGAFLTKQIPKILPIGETTIGVQYIGFGFTPFFVIEYLLPKIEWFNQAVPELHDGIAVVNLVVVDGNLATADVIVDSDVVWHLDDLGEPIGAPVRFNF